MEKINKLDAAVANMGSLVDFIDNAVNVINQLKIELDPEERLNFLERIGPMVVHSIVPLTDAVVELTGKIDALEQRIVDLEADAEEGRMVSLERSEHADLEA